MSINKDVVAALIALTKPHEYSDAASALQPTRPIVTRCTEAEIIAAAVQCEPLRSLLKAAADAIEIDCKTFDEHQKGSASLSAVIKAGSVADSAKLDLVEALTEAANA